MAEVHKSNEITVQGFGNPVPAASGGGRAGPPPSISNDRRAMGMGNLVPIAQNATSVQAANARTVKRRIRRRKRREALNQSGADKNTNSATSVQARKSTANRVNASAKDSSRSSNQANVSRNRNQRSAEYQSTNTATSVNARQSNYMSTSTVNRDNAPARESTSSTNQANLSRNRNQSGAEYPNTRRNYTSASTLNTIRATSQRNDSALWNPSAPAYQNNSRPQELMSISTGYVASSTDQFNNSSNWNQNAAGYQNNSFGFMNTSISDGYGNQLDMGPQQSHYTNFSMNMSAPGNYMSSPVSHNSAPQDEDDFMNAPPPPRWFSDEPSHPSETNRSNESRGTTRWCDINDPRSEQVSSSSTGDRRALKRPYSETISSSNLRSNADFSETEEEQGRIHRFAIIDDATPNGKIAKSRELILEKAFNNALVEHILSCNDASPFQITRSYFEGGIYMIRLASSRGIGALQKIVERLAPPWKGAKLRFIQKKQVNTKTHKTSMMLRGAAAQLNTETILAMLSKQNSGLNTSKWRICSRRNTDKDGVIFFMVIDDNSRNFLIKKGSRAFLLTSTVIFKEGKKPLGFRDERPQATPTLTRTGKQNTNDPAKKNQAAAKVAEILEQRGKANKASPANAKGKQPVATQKPNTSTIVRNPATVPKVNMSTPGRKPAPQMAKPSTSTTLKKPPMTPNANAIITPPMTPTPRKATATISVASDASKQGTKEDEDSALENSICEPAESVASSTVEIIEMPVEVINLVEDEEEENRQQKEAEEGEPSTLNTAFSASETMTVEEDVNMDIQQAGEKSNDEQESTECSTNLLVIDEEMQPVQESVEIDGANPRAETNSEHESKEMGTSDPTSCELETETVEESGGNPIQTDQSITLSQESDKPPVKPVKPVLDEALVISES